MSLSAITSPKSTASPSAATPAAQSGGTGAGSAAFDSVLSQLRNATGTESTTGGTGTTGKASDDATEDRFLKLLVAQMKNQDPLNPLDNAQVTTQLAQINTVKGIDKLNTSLQTLVEGSKQGSTSEAASMVGRSVLVEGDALELPKDGVAKAGFELAAAATSVRVDVLDRSGAVVDNIELGPQAAGLQTFQWDGVSGTRTLEPGTYSLRVTAVDGGSKVDATALTAAPVQAVTIGASGATLQLGAFGSKTMDQVRAIL
ncbi:MAG: flagellar hook assembly protein FlgD [Burkholderiales bacterium]|nr:MAG: flagellar hook assembly protein FlgD [Burkholderiales bacterium]